MTVSLLAGVVMLLSALAIVGVLILSWRLGVLIDRYHRLQRDVDDLRRQIEKCRSEKPLRKEVADG